MVSPFSVQPLSITGNRSERRRSRRRRAAAPMPLNVSAIQAQQTQMQANKLAASTLKDAPPVPPRQSPTTVVPIDGGGGGGLSFGNILSKTWEAASTPLLPEEVEKIPFLGSAIRDVSRPLELGLIFGTAGLGAPAAAALKASTLAARFPAAKIAANFVEPIVGGSMARSVAAETAVAIAAGKAAEEGSEHFGLAGGIIGGLGGGVLSAGALSRALRSRPKLLPDGTPVPNPAEIKEGVTVQDRLGFEIEEGEKQFFARPFTDEEIMAGLDRTARRLSDPSGPKPRDNGPLTTAYKHVGGVGKTLDPDDWADREFMLLKAKEEQADGLIERMIAGFDVRFREGIFEFDKETKELLIQNYKREFNPTPEGQRFARAYAAGDRESIVTTAPGPGGQIVVDADGNATVTRGPADAVRTRQEQAYKYIQALAQERDDLAADSPAYLAHIEERFGPVEVVREGVGLTEQSRRIKQLLPRFRNLLNTNPDAQFSSVSLSTFSQNERKNIIDLLAKGKGRRPSREVLTKTIREVHDELSALVNETAPPVLKAVDIPTNKFIESRGGYTSWSNAPEAELNIEFGPPNDKTTFRVDPLAIDALEQLKEVTNAKTWEWHKPADGYYAIDIDGVQFGFSTVGKKEIYIDEVRNQVNPTRGVGTRVMKEVMDWADVNGITLKLDAHGQLRWDASTGREVETEQGRLIEWYKKFDFKFDDSKSPSTGSRTPQKVSTGRKPLTGPELKRINEGFATTPEMRAGEGLQYTGRRPKLKIESEIRDVQAKLKKERRKLDRIAGISPIKKTRGGGVKDQGAILRRRRRPKSDKTVGRARDIDKKITELQKKLKDLRGELSASPLGAKHFREVGSGRRRGNVNTAAIRNLAQKLEDTSTTKARIDTARPIRETGAFVPGKAIFSTEDSLAVRKILSDDTIFERGLPKETIVNRLRKQANLVDRGGDAVDFPSEIVSEAMENDPAFFRTYVLQTPSTGTRKSRRQRTVGPRKTGPVRKGSRLSKRPGDTEEYTLPGQPGGTQRVTEQRTGMGYVPGSGTVEVNQGPTVRRAGRFSGQEWASDPIRPYEEDVITPPDLGYGRGEPTQVRSEPGKYGAPNEPPDISPEGDYYSPLDWKTVGIEKTQLSEVFESAFEGVDASDTRAFSFGKGMNLIKISDSAIPDEGVPYASQRYLNPKTGRVFTHEQAQYIADFHTLIGQVGKYMESVGMEIHKIPLGEGAFYTPRAVINLMREGFAIPNTQAGTSTPKGIPESFQNIRKYLGEEINEAVAKGINYQQNPVALMDGFLRGALRAARTKQLENNLIGAGVQSTHRSEIHAFRRAITLVAAGRTLSAATLERIYKVDKDLANELVEASLGNKTRVEIYDKKTGNTSWREIDQSGAVTYLPDGTEIPSPERMVEIRHKLNAKEETLKKFNDPLFEGQFFEPEDAKKLKAWLIGPNTKLRGLGEVGDAFRSLQASADYSAPFIQGLALLARDPLAWARGIKPMMQAWANPGQLSKYVFENEEFIREHPWLMVANPNEYFAGVGERGLLTRGFNKFDATVNQMIGREEAARGAGRTVAAGFKRFEQAFTFYGTYARVEMAKGLSPMAKTKVAEDNIRILTTLRRASETIMDIGTPLGEGQPRFTGSSRVIDPAELDFIAKIDPEMAGKLRAAQEANDPVVLRDAVIEAKFAAENGQIRPAALIEMQDIVNKMTGVFSPGSFVVGPKQEHFERSFLFFAPRYTRASLAAAGMLFKSGVGGHVARDTIMKMAGGGLLTYYLFATATGQEPQLDPRKGSFMTLDINGDRIGVGTVWTALARLSAKTLTDPAVLGVAGAVTTGSQQGLSETAGLSNSQLLFQSPEPGGTSLNSKLSDNQLISFFRGRTSVISSNMWDLAAGSDFIGNQLDSPPDIAKHIGSNALPFAFEGFLLGKPQNTGYIATAGEFFGARSHPVSYHERRKHLQNSLAGQVHNKPWDELNELQKSEIRNNSQELEDITVEARKDRVLRGEVIDRKVSEWYDERDKIRETFDKTLLVGQDLLETGQIDHYRFRTEFFSQASRNRRAALEALDRQRRFEGVREWLEYQDQRPGRTPEALEDVAYSKYLDTVILDPVLTISGTFDFRLQRQRIAEFKASLPEESRDEIYTYVLSRLEQGKDLPPLVQELVGGREEFKWYWGSADEVGSVTQQVISKRKDATAAQHIWIMWEEATSEEQYAMEEDKYTGPIIRSIRSMRDRVRSRTRELHSDLDIFLFRWGYTSKLVHPNNAFEGARADAKTIDPLDRYMLSKGDMGQQGIREGMSAGPVSF